jgi:hypothetical protein
MVIELELVSIRLPIGWFKTEILSAEVTFNYTPIQHSGIDESNRTTSGTPLLGDTTARPHILELSAAETRVRFGEVVQCIEPHKLYEFIFPRQHLLNPP